MKIFYLSGFQIFTKVAATVSIMLGCHLLNGDNIPAAFKAMGTVGPKVKAPPQGWKESIPTTFKQRVAKLPTKGISVASVYYENKLTPVNLPIPSDIKKSVSTFASPGEYEPLVFAVYSPAGHKNIQAEITSLQNTNGEIISKKNMDIRVMRYIAQPPYISRTLRAKGVRPPHIFSYKAGPLEKKNNFNIQAKHVQHIWLTIYVPKNTQPGHYKGKLTITPKNSKAQSIEIKIRVLPINLPEPPRPYGFYMDGTPWTGCRRQWQRPQDWDKLFAIWKAYGLNSPAFFPAYGNYGGYHLKYVNGKVSADFSEYDKLMKLIKGANLNGPVVLDVGSATKSFFDKTAGELAQKNSKNPKSVEILYSEFIKLIMRHAQEAKWPEIIIAPGEESTVAPILFRAAKTVPGVTTICISNSHWGRGNKVRSLIGKWADRIDIRQTNYFSNYIKSSALASGRKAWYYNLGYTRFSFGFILDKFDAGAYHQWAGEWATGNPYYLFPGPTPCWMNDYPSESGPLPTQALEISREGIDDSRYLSLLKKLIFQAKQTKSKKAKRIANEAEKLIKNIFTKMPEDSDDFIKLQKNNTHYLRQADKFRFNIVTSILKLQTALKGLSLTKPSSTKKQTKSVKNLFKPHFTASSSFKLPPNTYKSPKNLQKVGLPGYLAINKIDGAQIVWVPSTRDTRGASIRNGAFIMGSNYGPLAEQPIHEVELDGFWLYQHEVTVGEWKKFLKASGYKWGRPQAGKVKKRSISVWKQDGRAWDWALSFPDDYPIVRVNRIDAKAYAKWAGGKLPTEAQWEWSGRGPNGLTWPWGNKWDDSKVGFVNGKAPGKLFSVTHFPGDISWCGVIGLASGIREWCSDVYSAYENYYAKSERKNPHSKGKWSKAILRGGSSLYGLPARLRCSGRYHTEWYDSRVELNGFRLIIPVAQNKR